jgi:hypothetical protein
MTLIVNFHHAIILLNQYINFYTKKCWGNHSGLQLPILGRVKFCDSLRFEIYINFLIFKSLAIRWDVITQSNCLASILPFFFPTRASTRQQVITEGSTHLSSGKQIPNHINSHLTLLVKISKIHTHIYIHINFLLAQISHYRNHDDPNHLKPTIHPPPPLALRRRPPRSCACTTK